MAESREVRLVYSEMEGRMLDEEKRRGLAAKLLAVLEHFLGRAGLLPGSFRRAPGGASRALWSLLPPYIRVGSPSHPGPVGTVLPVAPVEVPERQR